MPPSVVTVAVEGDADEAVVRVLLKSAQIEMGIVHGRKGKGWLDKYLTGYNHAARHAPWLVLRDLDEDADCAPALSSRILRSPAPKMRFRIAVRAVEAWLLADSERMSDFLRIPAQKIPLEPEGIHDPKRALVELARGAGRRDVRQDMTPLPGTTAKVGPAYNARIIEFVQAHWRPEVAALRAASLKGCLRSLKGLTDLTSAKSDR